MRATSNTEIVFSENYQFILLDVDDFKIFGIKKYVL